MYKIGIIGDRDSVLGFMALGFSVHEAQKSSDAAKKLHELARSGEYAVLFITENFALELGEDIAKYKDAPLTKASRKMLESAGVKLVKSKPTKAQIVLNLDVKD